MALWAGLKCVARAQFRQLEYICTQIYDNNEEKRKQKFAWINKDIILGIHSPYM